MGARRPEPPEQEENMDAIGRLNVRVYTSQAQIPIMGATVAVTGEGKAGRRRLLSVGKTDSSGAVGPILVETPGRGESTVPGTERPYALCDVWAEHPGFAALLVEGVQIFAGVDTFQGMELNPLAQGESSLTNTQIRQIPGQSL